MKSVQNRQWSGRKSVPLFRIAAGILVLLLIGALCPIFPALRIESAEKTLLLPLKDGESFDIKYNHSVNHSPVIDTVQRTGDTLTVRQSLFLTYGAGIPVLSDEVGDTYTETDEGFVLSGIDAEHEEINLITGTYADHRLIIGQNEVVLKQPFGEKTLICFTADRVSPAQLFLYRIKR